MTKISIIVPYYKKKIFKKSINSVLTQTYKNFEVIIIYDDQNRDELKFVKETILNDKRVKLIINKKNIGAGYSRNIGIQKAKGEFVCFIDADDMWKKNKLKKQFEFMKNNRLLISHTSFEIIDESGKIISKRRARSFRKFNDLLFSCDIGLSTVMMKKSILNQNIKFPKIKTKEDFVLWLKILKKNFQIIGLDESLSYWKKNKQSLSSNTFQKILDGFRVYNIYMKFGYLRSFYYLIILSMSYLRKNY